MSQPIIEVDQLSKRYKLGYVGASSLRDELANTWSRVTNREKTNQEIDQRELWALREVSFSVNPGEIVGVIGRNGAGKSTLLKLLSRVTEPTSGHAIIRGRTASLLEVGTGFHPELSGRDNVFLSGAILGMKRAEIARKFDAIVDFAEVGRFIDTPVKRYSSGMYVRLAFSVAAHLDPEVLFVDEVLAVGDSQFQMKCISKMKQLTSSGKTILFVSHNLYTLQTLCTRGVLLSGGQIKADGTIEEALSAYRSNVSENFTSSKHQLLESAEVKLLNWKINGRPERSLQTNGKFDLTAEWTIEVRKPITAYLGASLRTPEGMQIYGRNTFLEKQPFNLEPGTYTGGFTFPDLDLPSGTYYIQMSVMDEHGTARHFDVGVAAVVTVTKADEYVGLIKLPHEWLPIEKVSPAHEVTS